MRPSVLSHCPSPSSSRIPSSQGESAQVCRGPGPVTHAHSVLHKSSRYPKRPLPRFISTPTLRFIASASLPFTSMTEYDYSPAAYERYINNQARVSNWVSSQTDHTQSYGNPFVPSAYIPTKPLPGEQASRKPVKSPPRSRSSTTSSPSSTTTPTKPARQPRVRSPARDAHPEQRHKPTRSMTMPAHPGMVYPMGQTFILPTSSRERHDRHDKHHSSPHRSSSHKSPTRSSHHSSRYDRGDHHRSSSTSRAYRTDRDASGRRLIQLEPGSRNKVIHLPPPQSGERYVFVRPPVCFPIRRVFATYHQSSPSVYQNPRDHNGEYGRDHTREKSRHHEKQQEPTFLKRIFGGFGLTGGSRNSSSSRSKSRTSSHRRRSSY